MHPEGQASAKWADEQLLVQRHRYQEGSDAFWVGRTVESQEPIGYKDDRHIFLCASSRSGKGTSIIIPNLCLYPGSVVVNDPKGELADITAARRGAGAEGCKGMDQKVYVLDPLRKCKSPSVEPLRARFNPLDDICAADPSLAPGLAMDIAEAVVEDATDRDNRWAVSQPRRLVRGVILHVVSSPEFEGRRHLGTVQRLIAGGDADTHKRLVQERDDKTKAGGEFYPLPSAHDLLWQTMFRNPAFDGVVQSCASEFMDFAGTNAGGQWMGVIQEARSALEFLDGMPAMVAAMECSDFSFRELTEDPNGVTIYITMPSGDYKKCRNWVRLMVKMVLKAIHGKAACGHRVLFIVDELPGLGYMSEIDEVAREKAGDGLRCCFVVQDLTKLANVYPNYQTIVNSCGTNIYFGGGTCEVTHKWYSDQLGETEIVVSEDSIGGHIDRSTNKQDTTGTSTDKSYRQGLKGTRTARKLLRDKVTGNQDVSEGKNEATATGESTGAGINTQTNRKRVPRKLATPAEVRQMFRRILDDEPTDERELCPGRALVLFADDRDPAVLQRRGYFHDHQFRDKYLELDGSAPSDFDERIRELKWKLHRPHRVCHDIEASDEALQILRKHASARPWRVSKARAFVCYPPERVWESLLTWGVRRTHPSGLAEDAHRWAVWDTPVDNPLPRDFGR